VIGRELPDFNAMSDDGFRTLVRDFVAANYPDIPRFAQRRLHWHEVKDWYLTLSRHGWICPTWPREYGGMALSAGKHLILIEEFEGFGCARANDIGPVMLGPLLIKYGTEAQKAHYLPRILSGDDIWTTLGMDANWIFILARTDKTVKKQAGISFLLVPMAAAGVTVRSIKNLELHEELCEVFFDNVRVPAGTLVGAVNQGWTIAKALLGHERVFIGAPRLSANAIARLRRAAEYYGAWGDRAFCDHYARLHMDVADLSDLFETYFDKLRSGEPIGADVAILKVFQSELYQRISEEMMEVAGEAAGRRAPEGNDPRLHASGTYLAARPTTIFGGSSEIMRNMIAKAVLGL
jgi:alkylation response protein AidB-like acyl-CoA dehydrogenase